VARVKAILRRSDRLKIKPKEIINIGDLTIDTSAHEVSLGKTVLELRSQEFDLLLTLIEHKGMVLSREQLLEKAWGFDYYGQTRTVDVHIAQLRKRIAKSKVQIDTVTGVGYKLVAH
jgi:DNA-binding response OmpR family regulator